MNSYDLLHECSGFQWGQGNRSKIWEKHHVSLGEAGHFFFNHPLVVGEDVKHSQDEPRFYALGETDAGRRLYVVFRIRETLIRVVSARDMSRKERTIYDSQ